MKYGIKSELTKCLTLILHAFMLPPSVGNFAYKSVCKPLHVKLFTSGKRRDTGNYQKIALKISIIKTISHT